MKKNIKMKQDSNRDSEASSDMSKSKERWSKIEDSDDQKKIIVH